MTTEVNGVDFNIYLFTFGLRTSRILFTSNLVYNVYNFNISIFQLIDLRISSIEVHQFQSLKQNGFSLK